MELRLAVIRGRVVIEVGLHGVNKGEATHISTGMVKDPSVEKNDLTNYKTLMVQGILSV